MQATIALFLCSLFVAVALIREPRRASIGLWVPQLWFLISASRPVYLWIRSGAVVQRELDYLSGNPVDRMVLSILLLIGLVILAQRKVNWQELFRGNAWFLALVLFMGASILWSDVPGVSFKRWMRSTGDLVMVLVVLTEKKPLEAMTALLMRLAIVLLPFSIVLIKYIPRLGVAYTEDGLMTMWIGVTTHKNELGALAMICGIFLFWRMLAAWKDRRVAWLDVSLMIMVVWLLRGSTTADSKTSTLAFLLSSSILLVLYALQPGPRLANRIFAWAVAVFLVLNTLTETLADASLYEYVVRASGRDPTLTGRTDLWKDLIAIAAQNPVLGKGYGSFWIGNLHQLWDKFIWLPTQAHNGYIDVALELGFTGLLLFFGAIQHAYRNIIGQLGRDPGCAGFRLVFFIMILVHNLTESSFLRGSSALWDIFLLVALIPPATVSETQRNRQQPAAGHAEAACSVGKGQAFVMQRRRSS